MPPSTVVIKKYGNRRLYDTSSSRYVNLDEIASMVRQGKQLQVVDAKSGEDLTRVTLTQIITEDARDKPTGLPLELLRQLIVASDQARQEFIMWYLRSAFDTYQKVQDALHSRVSDVQSALMSPLETMKQILGGAPQAGPPSADAELAALRQRIAELEARVPHPTRKPRRTRGSNRK